jgi:hypothetical protein
MPLALEALMDEITIIAEYDGEGAYGRHLWHNLVYSIELTSRHTADKHLRLFPHMFSLYLNAYSPRSPRPKDRL